MILITGCPGATLYRSGTLKWGFVPSWSKDPNIGYKMINARGETIADKPSFRDSFEHKRCVLLADAFYEWKRTGSEKQPMCIRMNDEKMFLLAGLWSRYVNEQGKKTFTTTIVTTSNNELMENIHDRMPVITISCVRCDFHEGDTRMCPLGSPLMNLFQIFH